MGVGCCIGKEILCVVCAVAVDDGPKRSANSSTVFAGAPEAGGGASSKSIKEVSCVLDVLKKLLQKLCEM